MNDELFKTVRIRRKRITTDERGRSVWDGEVEDLELELVSTQMLQGIIDSGDDARKARLRKAAGSPDGVLAREAGSGEFQVISDDELKAALQTAATTDVENRPADVVLEPVSLSTDPVEELSLVSTQALRRILDEDGDSPVEEETFEPPAGGGGFDPYNSA